MMAEHTTGIAGSQAKVRENATSMRNTSKGRHKKFMPYFAGLLIVMALLMWWKDYPFAQKFEEAFPTSTTSTILAKRKEVVVKWSQRETDGSIPVGLWSETIKKFQGCSILFDGGNGTKYKVRHQYNGDGWKDHVPGAMVVANEFQVQAIEPGMKEVAFPLQCS